MDKIPSHDDFIRSILSNKELAKEYFKSYLPAFVSSRLDFSRLQQLPDTYLSDELRKSISDIVYSCKLKGRQGHIIISLLIEHKSYPDKNTPIQMGSYIFSAYQKQIRNKESLRLVIPILLYHGKEKWRYQTLSGLFSKIPKEWKVYLPNFEVVFNSLGELTDDQIVALGNKFLAASFLALKHGWEKAWLEENAVRIFLHASEGPEGERKALIIYVGSRSNLKENILNSLPEPVKKDVMNTLDVFYEKGMKKGMEVGIVKGIEKGREEGREEGRESIVKNLINSGQFTLSEIASFAGVPVSFVKKLQSAAKKKK